MDDTNRISRTSDLAPGKKVNVSPPLAKLAVTMPKLQSTAAAITNPPIAPKPEIVAATMAEADDEAGRRGASTSVYFSSRVNLDYLIALGKKRSRASVSSVVSQLLAQFVAAAKKIEAEKGQASQITIETFKVHV